MSILYLAKSDVVYTSKDKIEKYKDNDDAYVLEEDTFEARDNAALDYAKKSIKKLMDSMSSAMEDAGACKMKPDWFDDGFLFVYVCADFMQYGDVNITKKLRQPAPKRILSKEDYYIKKEYMDTLLSYIYEYATKKNWIAIMQPEQYTWYIMFINPEKVFKTSILDVNVKHHEKTTVAKYTLKIFRVNNYDIVVVIDGDDRIRELETTLKINFWEFAKRMKRLISTTNDVVKNAEDKLNSAKQMLADYQEVLNRIDDSYRLYAEVAD